MKDVEKSNSELLREIENLKAEVEKYKNQIHFGNEVEKHTISRLEEKEAVFSQFINASKDAIVLFDENLILVDINNTALKYIENIKKRKNLIGKHFNEIYSLTDNPEIIATYKEVLQTGKPYYIPSIIPKNFPDYLVSIHAFKVGNGLGIVFSDITEITKTNDALNKSEIKLKNLLNHSSNVFITFSVDQKITFVSKQIEQFLGYSPDFVKSDFYNILSDIPQNKIIKEHISLAIETGLSQSPFELEFIDATGNKKYGNIWLSPVEKDNRTIEVVSSINDVTDIKNYNNQLNLALQESQKRETEKSDLLRAARSILRNNTFESAAFEIFVICQKSLGATTGFIVLDPGEPDKSELIGIINGKINNHYNQKDLSDNIIKKIADISENKQTYYVNQCENVAWLNDIFMSDLNTQNCLFSPLIVDNKVVCIFGFYNKPEDFGNSDRVLASAFSDLASISFYRIRNEGELKHSEQLFREMFTNMATGVAIYESPDNGINFYFKDINPAGLLIGNNTYDEHIGNNIKDVYPGVEKMGILDVIKRVYKTGKSEHFPMTIYSDDRIELWVENYIYKIPSGDIVAVYDNKTESKKLEEKRVRLEKQLNQAQKMEAVGQLAGGIAHDFNNLLTVIIGNIELLLLDADENSDLANEISEIAETADRASKLTQKLLTFSRKHLVQMTNININSVLDSTVNMLYRTIPENIEIDINEVDKPWNLKADINQIEQVVLNLAINASDAMPSGGMLSISTKNTTIEGQYCSACSSQIYGEYVELCVVDNGSGIKKENIDKIFEPYFTTKEVGKGTGLGLSIIYGIVNQHKGHILLDSTFGKGTAVRILLPRSETHYEFKPETEVSHAEFKGNELILVVEDNDAVRKSTVKSLHRFGYNTFEVSSAVEALEKITNQNITPDLILSDVVMPRISGPEMVSILKEKGYDFPVLFVSGYPRHHLQVDKTDEEKVPLLAKPFKPGELVKTIRSILDNVD